MFSTIFELENLQMEVACQFTFLVKLLDAYDKMLLTGKYELSWYHTDFNMIPKKGDPISCYELASSCAVENHVHAVVFPQQRYRHVCNGFWTATNQQISLAFHPNMVLRDC